MADARTEEKAFEDGDFCAAVRLRLRQDVGLGLRCSNTSASGWPCAKTVDPKGDHALTCKKGPGVFGKHNGLVRLLARLLRAAGYNVATEVWEPRWNKIQRDRQGRPKRDRRGNVLQAHARLDLRLQAPPEEPLTYGDVVVGHPCAESWVRDAANVDGATAEVGVRRKLKRYPPEMLPSAKLVAFSVETWGRWAPEAVAFLKRAAGRAAQRSPGLASPDEGGANAVYAAWLRQLSCALQKGNVACLRGAASGQPRNSASGEQVDEGGDEEIPGWLEEQIDDLIAQAAAAAGVETGGA